MRLCMQIAEAAFAGILGSSAGYNFANIFPFYSSHKMKNPIFNVSVCYIRIIYILELQHFTVMCRCRI